MADWTEELPALAESTDCEAAVAISKMDKEVRALVPRWKIKDYLYRAGKWPLLLGAQAAENLTVKGTAITAVAYLSDGDFDNLDLDLPGISQMFGVLQAAGVMSEEDATAIDAMADAVVPKYSPVGGADVRDARSRLNG